MSSVEASHTDIVEEAKRILSSADGRAVSLKLLGGTAVKMVSPSSRKGPLSRPYPEDLDFAGYSFQSKEIKSLFLELGYAPNSRFNALHGSTRLQFIDEKRKRVFDLFLDVFKMCHVIRLKGRLAFPGPTLPLADLLLTKAQIVKLNVKDVKDMLSLIYDSQLGEDDQEGTINTRYVSNLCSEDWGLYKTVTANLSKLIALLDNYAIDTSTSVVLREKILRILKLVEVSPKTIRWRLRSAIGERAPWYDLPEAPVREPGNTYEAEERE